MHVSITCHSACSSCTSPHLTCLFSPILSADSRSMAIGERQCYATKTAESNLAQTTKAIKVAALPAAPPPVVLSTFLPLSLPPLRCISPPHVSIVCVLQPAQASCTWQIQASCVCPSSKCSSNFSFAIFTVFQRVFPTLMLPLVFHFMYLLIFSQISSFSMENVLAKTFLQHVFKFHPHNACDQIICCSQPVAVGPSPSPASAPSVAPRLSLLLAYLG